MQTKLLLGTVAAIALLGTSAIAQDNAVEDAAEATGEALGNAAEATGDAVQGAGEAVVDAGEGMEMPNDGRFTMQMDDAGEPVLNDAGEPTVLRADGSEASSDEYRIDENNDIILLVAQDEAEADVQETQEVVEGEATAGEGEFIVEQAEPTVNVDVPDPVVTVDQAQPEVTVEQPTPEITVEVAPPTVNVEQQQPVITVQQQQPVVTVTIPEPVVTVRMPQPDVQVSQDDPQVQVETPQPIVRYVRPEPQIRVQQAEAEVNVTAAEPEVNVNRTTSADVRIEQAEADVQVEETGEATVNVTEAEPQVEVEQAAEADVQVEQADAEIQVEREGDAEVVEADPAAVAELETQGFIVRADATETEEQRTTRIAGYEQFTDSQVDDLIGMNVLADDGEDVGEVDNIATMGDRLMAVVGVGGFLGLGERNVAVPLDRMMMDGDNLVISGLGSDQIQNIPEYDEASAEYAPTDGRIGDLYE